jgi:hypothetical protein
MTIADHVALTISQDSVSVARAGFGVPLILSATASFSARLEYVADLSDVVGLGFATDSPEYLACAAIFGQNPAPSRVAIGRCALPPTQKYKWTPTAINDHDYVINVAGEGVTATVCSYTSDATATVAEICAGMEPLLTAVVGKNFAVVDNSTDLEITGATAGDWFSLEQVDPGDGKIEQTHVDPGVATDLAAIQLEQDDWYALLTHFNSSAYVLAAAAWVEAQKKIYLAGCSDSECITLAAGGGDWADDFETSAYARCSAIYHPAPVEMIAQSLAGDCLPLNPGSLTWKFRTLSGVPAVQLTSTHKTNLLAKNAIGYAEVAGVNVTLEGTVGDGDFIDVVRGLDWLDDDMTAAVFGLMAGADKVPYTDDGAAMIQSEIEASLQRGINRTILAADPAPVVTVPAVADQSDADKAARHFPDIKFSATLAGAIHKVTITGVVSV